MDCCYEREDMSKTIYEIFNGKFVGSRIVDIEVIRPFVKKKYLSSKKEYKRLHRLIRRVYKMVLFNPGKVFTGSVGRYFGVRFIE